MKAFFQCAEMKDHELILDFIECLGTILVIGDDISKRYNWKFNPFLVEISENNLLQKIENIQRIDNDEVYENITLIMDQYFVCNDTEMEVEKG